MSSTPGALEIVREAFDRMRTPVAVDVPPSREERAAAWGRLKAKLVNWSAPTLPPVNEHGNHFAPHPFCAGCDGFHGSGHCLASKSEPEEFVFRTKLPETVWRDLTLGEDIFLQPMVDRTLAVIEKRMAALIADNAALVSDNELLDRALKRRDARIAELKSDLAAFTALNVRPLDEKPELAPIFRAIAPSRTDPRRLGLA